MIKKSETIKQEIFSLVKKYYLTTQEEKQNVRYIHYAGRVYDEKEILNLVDASLEFYLTSGRFTKEFEKKFSDFIGVKYSYFVNSGSSANLLAFSALTSSTLGDRQIKPGDHVITTALCFPTTIAPIIQNGCVPIFVDVDLETANINTEKLIESITPQTKCIMLAHTLGNPFDIKAIRDICDKNNIWLLGDCCDSLGSTYGGKPLEQYADISTTSFYPAHHITCGEGGMVSTNCSILANIIHSMRDWGRDCVCETGQDNKCGHRFNKQFGKLPLGYDHKYVYSHLGYNLKATDMQASIAVAQLQKLPKFVQKRKDNWMKLYKALNYLSDHIIFQKNNYASDPSWFGFLMTLKNKNRNEFAQYLENKGIATRNLFAGNILLHPCFDHLEKGVDYIVVGDLPNTNYITNNSVWIGVAPIITKKNINYMIKIIKGYFGQDTNKYDYL